MAHRLQPQVSARAERHGSAWNPDERVHRYTTPHGVSAARRAIVGRGMWPKRIADLRRWIGDRQRDIASKGGRAAHQKGSAHEWTSEEAREAGRKGGLVSHRRKLEQQQREAAGGVPPR